MCTTYLTFLDHFVILLNEKLKNFCEIINFKPKVLFNILIEAVQKNAMTILQNWFAEEIKLQFANPQIENHITTINITITIPQFVAQ